MQKQDELSLGNTASGGAIAPPSTPSTKALWRLDRWGNRPERYTIVGRTAKTLQVKEDDTKWSSGWVRRVNTKDIGHEWFLSERDAWMALLEQSRAQVEADKQSLQRSRTDLGMVESEIKRRGYA